MQSVRLHYRHLRQDENYIATDMAPKAEDIYEATIPSDFLDPTWDLMYLIEATGTSGNGSLYPDLEKEIPYVVVNLKRDEKEV